MQQEPKFEVSQLERLSKSWDKRTTNILLRVSGHGNMFGGSGCGYLLTVHGENSIEQTGKIDIKGVFIDSYNISRGANGDNRGRVAYYGNITDINLYEDNFAGPNFEINVKGSCDTGIDTLCTILSAKLDFIIK